VIFKQEGCIGKKIRTKLVKRTADRKLIGIEEIIIILKQ
jgi:hypothetical protein